MAARSCIQRSLYVCLPAALSSLLRSLSSLQALELQPLEVSNVSTVVRLASPLVLMDIGLSSSKLTKAAKSSLAAVAKLLSLIWIVTLPMSDSNLLLVSVSFLSSRWYLTRLGSLSPWSTPISLSTVGPLMIRFKPLKTPSIEASVRLDPASSRPFAFERVKLESSLLMASAKASASVSLYMKWLGNCEVLFSLNRPIRSPTCPCVRFWVVTLMPCRA